MCITPADCPSAADARRFSSAVGASSICATLGYDAHIASFQARDPVRVLRRRLDEHRLSAFQGRFVLLVSLAMSGGVERFVTERCRELRSQGLHPLILRPAASGDTRRCELWTEALELPNLHFDIPSELPAVSGLLRALRLQAIEIQHFLHLDARVIDAVRALPVPYDLFVHDYAWICPRVTLIDGSGRYCGEPAVSVCQRCVSKNGSNLGERISVPALRSRSSGWLRGARRVLAPSLAPRHGCASISPVLRYRCAPTPRLNCPQLPRRARKTARSCASRSSGPLAIIRATRFCWRVRAMRVCVACPSNS